MKLPFVNEHLVEDLIRLRNEIGAQAFPPDQGCADPKLAEIVFKINSCLYTGYPERNRNEEIL